MPARTPARQPSLTLREARLALRSLANPEKAAFMQRYFKTGKGQYGQGDRFLGVMVPQLRQTARQFRGLRLPALRQLLRSGFHEERSLALMILVIQFEKADPTGRKRIVDFYFDNLGWVNNWDLVDCSAPYILGAHLQDRSRALLDRLARSRRLWERRIAIIATGHFITQGQFADTLRIAAALLDDDEDLIHKAAGWMLREVGKHNVVALEGFLERHADRMPRTMLRYAIERFPKEKRGQYLARGRGQKPRR
jgi:3-methyladenine DNA glycosylase AlkD